VLTGTAVFNVTGRPRVDRYICVHCDWEDHVLTSAHVFTVTGRPRVDRYSCVHCDWKATC
jgi:hypothetical protein